MSEILQKLFSNYEHFIDFESSGLSEEGYPIEVGVASSQEQFEALIIPVPKWTYWNSRSQKVHGISRSLLDKEGTDALEVAKEMNARFKDKTLWCDSKFDVWWFDVLFDAVGIKPTFSVKNIEKALPTELWERLVLEMPSRDKAKHRALEDALDLQEAWIRVKKQVLRSEEAIERIEKQIAETA